MSKKTATCLGRVNMDANGHQVLYYLSPPLADHDDETHEYVVASAAVMGGSYGGMEVYLFPSDVEGNVTDWGELPGSIKGTIRHEDALAEVGYEVQS